MTAPRLGAPLALLAVACGQLSEVPPDRCAAPDADWWPLPNGAEWRLQTNVNGEAERLLFVEQRGDVVRHPEPGASWHTATAVRLQRREPGASGWRWVRETPEGFFWLRDLWSVEPAPMDMDPVRDATKDVYYDPYRVRLETAPGHLCEGEGWRREYRKVTIKIFDDPAKAASTDCPRATWLQDPAGCVEAGLYTTTTVVENWTVESVGRYFEVGGNAFDQTVCVRRREVEGDDFTYCFAAGVGKFLEYSKGDPSSDREQLESWTLP